MGIDNGRYTIVQMRYGAYICFVCADMDDSGFLEGDGTVEEGAVGEQTEESQGAVESSSPDPPSCWTK